MPHPRWHLRFSLGILCLMLTLPFLNPHHYNPIPTFYQEWTAAACALLAATLLLRKKVFEQLEFPEIALLPLGLAGVLLAQFACGLVAFPSQALIFTLYLFLALLILALGRSLRQQIALENLVGVFAGAILCGTLLASTLLALQLVDPQLGLGLVFSYVRGGGNLGQANHLANYLSLGLASAIYLHIQGKIGIAAFVTIALTLVSGASFTGSRSIIAYAAGFALLSVWAAWHFRQDALRRIAKITLWLLPATIILQLAFSYFNVGSALQTAVSGERLFHLVSGTSQRLQLWRTGLEIFFQHPWLGAGIGQFPLNAYLVVGAQPDGTYLGGGEHAHNLLIHLLSEFGLIAPVLVIALGLRWWLRFIGQAWTAAHWWIATVLLVLTTHSQLEYPLWYTFFLGIAALVLGVGSAAGFHPRITASSRLLIALALLLGALTLVTLGNDYRKLERTLNWQLNDDGERLTWKETLAAMGKLQRESLFSQYIQLSYAYQLSIDKESLKDKITVSEMAIRFSPVDLITYKLAYLLALDGRMDDAKVALQRAVATHPHFAPTALRQLEALSETHPEITALRDELRSYPNANK
jgi:O-antigen ligase